MPQEMNNQEPQPFGFEMSNSMAGDSQMMGSQKSMDQAGVGRPPVFVENSMDCHNVAMNID